MVIGLLVSLEIRDASKAAEFASKLVEFAEGYRKDQGTLDWHVYQDPKDPKKFAIVERYENQQAIKTHTSNPLYAEFGKLAGSMLVGKPKITPYTELDHKAKL